MRESNSVDCRYSAIFSIVGSFRWSITNQTIDYQCELVQKRRSKRTSGLISRIPLNTFAGVDYRGVLACLDGYMNIALEATEEYVNGQLKNKYGDAFIRGNNVLYISTVKRAR